MPDLSGLEPIAVTGATGFIGKYLVRAMVECECRPILLTRRGKNHQCVSEFDEELQTHEIDLADGDSVREALSDIKPATIFHLAGTRGRGDARLAKQACMELNFNATVRLLEAAIGTGVRRVVIVGSAEEYGNQPGPLDESLPTQATSSYGISKAMATEHALAMHSQNRCPVVVVRPFSVYGPGQPRDMFIAEAVDSAVHNVEFRMSRGTQMRDLIFVDDVVRGLISAACSKDAEGHAINLGTGQAHRLRDVAERIWSMTRTTAPLLVGARESSDEELCDTWADLSLARRLLNWEPRVDLETGLKRTIDFAKEQLGTKAQTCQVM